MFNLVTFRDTVAIQPNDFRKPFKLALVDEIDKKYANRIVHQVGLCIVTFDLIECQEPFVYPADGASHVKVTFRMLVFKPFIGEIIQGKIRSADEEGIHVSVEFFNDIFIPRALLWETCRFNSDERVWVWDCDGTELYLDLKEDIRLRIVAEEFIEPVKKKANEPVEEQQTPSYSIVGALNEDGLGCLTWWQQTEEVEEESV